MTTLQDWHDFLIVSEDDALQDKKEELLLAHHFHLFNRGNRETLATISMQLESIDEELLKRARNYAIMVQREQ